MRVEGEGSNSTDFRLGAGAESLPLRNFYGKGPRPQDYGFVRTNLIERPLNVVGTSIHLVTTLTIMIGIIVVFSTFTDELKINPMLKLGLVSVFMYHLGAFDIEVF